jgi:putative methyltransferase
MFQVFSSQFNYQYGNNIHVPYSIGTLVSYLKSKDNIKSKFEFKKTAVFRDRVDEYIQAYANADILLCSCYVWNWEITNYLAKKVKENNPNCLVVFGGPHVPQNTSGFFDDHPYVDILVHGEGEVTIEEIFRKYLEDKNYEDVKGISTKEYNTLPRERIEDFSILPSPYLDNTIWDLVDRVEGIRWDVSWETNRGCPYLCTFCDWGSATFTKLRKFGEDKLFNEIDWFTDNKISYIYCCDANFGIFADRDKNIAKKIKENKLTKKYPETFVVNWAKNSSDRIMPVAKELHEGNLLTGITLSVQSLDENTLDIVKRANIKFDKFSDLAEDFRSQGFPTYSEVIRGLPGETLESFKDGLENMVGESNIETIYIFPCIVLPNAPMNLPEYKEKYAIKTIHSPISLRHTSIQNETMDEFENLITNTSSFNFDDLKEMHVYSWVILTFQNLGIMQYVAKYYNQMYGLKFVDFYAEFLKYCRSKKSIFSEEYENLVEYMKIGYSGKGWNHFDSKIGDINWPIEEASWLRLVSQKDTLSKDIYQFLINFDKTLGYDTSEEILKDLTKLQMFLLSTFDKNESKSENLKFNWKKFFINTEKVLEKEYGTYLLKNQVIEPQYSEWCKKVMWHGRHHNSQKSSIQDIKVNEMTIDVSK